MAEDLISRYENLRLEEDEGGIVDLGDVDSSNSQENFNLLLIGRLVTERPYNVEAFKATMTKVWALSRKIVIRVLGPNLFAFQFFHWRDKQKVLDGRAWCFDNLLLVLKEVEGDKQPERIALYHSPFWVRIKHLPFNCRSDSDVRELVSNLGEVLEIEEDLLGLDRYRRVRVLINIAKPLRQFQRIRDKGGKEICVEFAYERLPYFCFACGVIGHSEKDCELVSEETKKQKLGWGGEGEVMESKECDEVDLDVFNKCLEENVVTEGLGESSVANQSATLALPHQPGISEKEL
ncbi:uncharacterized protein LOC110688781 [Chenopodium quinoa]|uniref:uncharacterized protein LOC110688781 n=1 Tax=Chenopodium quinoa TaxID=63459 RepID=UPI000B787F38|nr:uncharacterized protein LOC110688781 [Chenopodium quinoa]